MTKRRRLIYKINLARHTMMKTMDAGCQQKLGISTTQLTALMVLKERENCLMKELAEALMLDNSAITGLAKRMQNNQLIERVPCESDSRASRLRLSAKGREVLSKGMGLLIEVNTLMEQGFSEEELDTVARYLDQVTDIFSNKDKLI